MKKILIAGLPSAGKSTYIGALSYILQNPSESQIFRFAENPGDLTNITHIYDQWLEMEPVERTARGNGFISEFRIKKADDIFEICFPDLAGEDFEQTIENDYSFIQSWSQNVDAILYFININDIPVEIFSETVENGDNCDKAKIPSFDVQKMSMQIRNVMLLKGLVKVYHCKQILVGLSAWDTANKQDTPNSFLQSRAPLLYNYLKHLESQIIGISAQGVDYAQIDKESWLDKTENGERAFIVNEKEKIFDITKPLDLLLS